MAHAKLTVSLAVLVAVIVLILNPPDVVVDCVTPPLNVAVRVSAYLSTTIPDPPAPPSVVIVLERLPPPPPPPVFGVPATPLAIVLTDVPTPPAPPPPAPPDPAVDPPLS
jgi:hypothetical protein